MRIFKFHPARFERMYFVATSLDEARTKEDEVWARYHAERVADFWAGDIAETRAAFHEGFLELEEDALAFIDTAY